jgi:hypothetical protein
MSKTVTQFDRQNVKTITQEMMNELNKMGEKYGVSFGRKSCRFGQADFRITVTAQINSENRDDGVLTKEELAYNVHRITEDLPELGTEYYSNGLTMTIIGWNTRARKYPVNLMGSDGRKYKNSVYGVKSALNG